MYKEVRGVIVAATKSGSGKTMAALSLMKLLADEGLKVAPFKTGPDFIDTSHYEKVCGVKGRNLDSFMMTEDFLKWNLCSVMEDRDVAVIEGVMGLFDGYGEDAKGSTAELAKKLGLPVLLLVDAKGMSQSIVPLIHGFLNWDKGLPIVGVILNRVNTERQYVFLKSRIEKIGIKCFGYIPTIPEIKVPERHLGIAMGYEQDKNFVEGLKKAAACLDKKRLLNLLENSSKKISATDLAPVNKVPINIAVAYDEAFSFIYQENITLFKQNGAYVHYFSPLNDETFGLADLVYLPGGYPELFIRRLAENNKMKDAITDFVEKGGHLIAECGGLIYLSKEIIIDGVSFSGVNILPFTIEMGKRFSALGYVDVIVQENNPFFEKGTALKGHRFHYSYIKKIDTDVAPGYLIKRKETEEKEGFVYKNLLASYVHLHFGSNPDAVGMMFKKIDGKKTTKNLQLIEG